MHAIKQSIFMLGPLSYCLNYPGGGTHNFINISKMISHKSFTPQVGSPIGKEYECVEVSQETCLPRGGEK
jgi:hypothetical protein